MLWNIGRELPSPEYNIPEPHTTHSFEDQTHRKGERSLCVLLALFLFFGFVPLTVTSSSVLVYHQFCVFLFFLFFFRRNNSFFSVFIRLLRRFVRLIVPSVEHRRRGQCWFMILFRVVLCAFLWRISDVSWNCIEPSVYFFWYKLLSIFNRVQTDCFFVKTHKNKNVWH